MSDANHSPTQLDRILDRFEDELEQGNDPDIANYLAQIPDGMQEQYLHQLIDLQIIFRLKTTSQACSPTDYQQFGDTAVEHAHGQIEKHKKAGNQTPTLQIDEGSTVDRYRLLERIGVGGMGSVWKAQQEQPVQRVVALKLIKDGFAGSDIIARFEAERQALAMMNHPNIAKVLDGGTTESGNPYFVMDLIEGVPITQFCDEQKLSIKDRLSLFIPVCKAVQHAHQKRIIHRDLKPSNVLVTLEDDKAVPKVIDFGLAKAMDNLQLSQHEIETEFGRIAGTWQYMSPEQAGGKPHDIDTTTDIYSLGVMLYELLAGSTPLAKEDLREKALLDVLKIIREVEPPRPSTRLSTTDDSISEISSRRRIGPAKLRTELKGELDWIVMKALDKEQSQRYETATSLAEELQRYIDNEPVQVRPPTTSYRLSKFVSRNKGLVASLTTIAALLIAAVAVSGSYAVQADVARKDALKEKQIADEKTKEAEKSARRSKDALKIFTDSFRSVDPSEGANAGMLAKDVLFRAKDSLEDSELDDHGRAELLEAISLSFLGVGEIETAVFTAEECREIFQLIYGRDHERTLRSMNLLATVYSSTGQLEKALKLNEETLEATKRSMGFDHEDTLRAMSSLANSYSILGRQKESLELKERTYELTSSKFGMTHVDSLKSMGNVAIEYAKTGQLNNALDLFEDTLELSSLNLGEMHPYTLKAMGNLANIYSMTGRMGEALDLDEKTLDLRRKKLGPSHPDTLMSLNNLANRYEDFGKHKEALGLREQCYSLMEAKLPNHPMTLTAMGNLARSYLAVGRTTEATELPTTSLKRTTSKLGPEHPDTAFTMRILAQSYSMSGKHQEAGRLFERTLQLSRKNLGNDHPETWKAMGDLAVNYENRGMTDKSIELKEETMKFMRARLPDHSDTLTAMGNLAFSYHETGRFAEAINLFEKVLELRQAELGPDHRETLTTMGSLAYSYYRARRIEEAIELSEKTLDSRRKILGQDDPDTQFSVALLGVNYKVAGRIDEAIPLLEEAYEASKKNLKLSWVDAQLRDAYVQGNQKEELWKLVEEQVSSYRKMSDPKKLEDQLAGGGEDMLQVGAFEKAERLLKECHELCLAKNPDGWLTFNTQSLLGGAILKQGRFVEAKPLLTESYDGLKSRSDKIPESVRHRRLLEAVERLIELAKKTEYDADLEKWKAEKKWVNKEYGTKPNNVSQESKAKKEQQSEHKAEPSRTGNDKGITNDEK